MMTFIHLTRFFFIKQLKTGAALPFAALIGVLIIVAMFTGARMREDVADGPAEQFGSEHVSMPIVSMDVGSVHTQVWEATNFTYITTVIPGGILLPFRLAGRWLFIILPFVGMLFAAREISEELESGFAQSLHATPVHPAVVGMARVLAMTLSTSICILAVFALSILVLGRFVHLDFTGGQVARSLLFALALGLYTSVFVLVGNLMSATLRSSVYSLWACIAIGLLIFAAQMVGENLFISTHREYPAIPRPPRKVNVFLSDHDMWRIGEPSTPEELEADATPEVYKFLLNLESHGEQVFELVDVDYQRERWYSLISPVHAIWEIAGQLLQDRHEEATEIFAPRPQKDPPPSIRASLRSTWPEIAGMIACWLTLFAINVRVLSKLEV